MKTRIRLTVNGKAFTLDVESNQTLVEVLRDQMGLTGTKVGCGVGDCGSCTVLMNGKAVNSCLVLAGEADGKEVLTIEGVSTEESVHPIQQAFIDQGAVQCGFCTPGMVLSAKALLDQYPTPSESQLRTALSGNLCRCTGYQKIIRAVQDASKKI